MAPGRGVRGQAIVPIKKSHQASHAAPATKPRVPYGRQQRIGHGDRCGRLLLRVPAADGRTASASGIPGSPAARALLAWPVNPWAARSSHLPSPASPGFAVGQGFVTLS